MGAVLKTFRKAENIPQEDIYQWLLALRENAYIPSSGYRVSAVIQASSGGERYYFGGVNCENIEQSLSTHSEDGAIAAMVTALGRCAVIEQAWVMGAPGDLTAESKSPRAALGGSCCGRCRQRMAAFSDDNTIVHSVALTGDIKTQNMADILPQSFSFKDYAPEIVAGMACASDLRAVDEDKAKANLVRSGAQDEDSIFGWLSELEAVSYASKVSQCVVLQLENGCYVAGARVEDAAFTGVNAVQSALAIAQAEYGTVRVKKLFVLTSSPHEEILPKNAVQPLSLAALQSLCEFSDNHDIEIMYFNAAGQSVLMTLQEATQQITNFKTPYIEL